MDTELTTELYEFKQKKEDVMKNIELLNGLSDKLTISIQNEEKKAGDTKIRDIIETKKKQSAHELEFLQLDNLKMEGYLEVLVKKQELEFRYLNQLCEQRAKIDKLSEKYPHIDINSYYTYDEYYRTQISGVKRKTKKSHHKPEPEPEQKQIACSDCQYYYDHIHSQYVQIQQLQQQCDQQHQLIQQTYQQPSANYYPSSPQPTHHQHPL